MAHQNTAPKVALFMPEHTARQVFSDSLLASLAGEAHIVPGYFSKSDSNPALHGLADVDYLFTGWSSPVISSQVLAAAPRLKAVFHCAGSVNAITSKAFWESGIPIASANEVNSLPVAEFTYAQIILSLKGFWQNTAAYRKRRQIPPDRKLAPGTRGATIGLISFGAIARRLVEKLRHLDLRILVYDPYVSPQEAEHRGVELVDLDNLFQSAEIVSCHAPLTEDTRHMVTEGLLQQMPRNAVLINTARGEIIEPDGLIRCLRARPDLYALLDVTHPEPLPEDSELFDLPNACVSAHIAGSIGHECLNLGEAMIEEFKRHRSGQPLRWAISPERAALMT